MQTPYSKITVFHAEIPISKEGMVIKMENNTYPFVNLPLPYSYNALEPFIDEKTMRLHHDRHLQTYINNLNDTLKDYPSLQKLSLEQLIRNASRLPPKLQTPVRNNAGGVYNHRLFFNGLTNPSEPEPNASLFLTQAINRQFGSFQAFLDEFKKAALSVFGSGYAWLVADQGRLRIVTTPNQNSPIEQNLCPIFTIDVWEHAYYLKHYNVRANYIDDWLRVINWNEAENKYLRCLRGTRTK